MALAMVLVLAFALAASPVRAADKVLRYAFRIAETGFDPAQISDLYSRNIASNIFDAPLQFAFMARPAQLRPNTAAELPTVSDDFRRYTFRLKPGIFFADDPAFGGQPRELVAADYVYAWKRHYDPRWKSPKLYLLEGAQLIGSDGDGDGWREHASGQRLVVELATQSDQQSRQLTEQWQKNLDAIGIRLRAKTAQWPENLKNATAGKLRMWNMGWNAAVPDGEPFLALADGRSKGQANKSRFDLPAFNELFARQKRLPNGPERRAAMLEAQKLMIAYMPMKLHVHRVYADLIQPRVVGYHRNIFVREFWKYIDIDPAATAPAL